MKSPTDSVRITRNCRVWWWLCLTVMGALSPGRASGPDLGLGENSLQPRHWYNNSTPSTLYCQSGYTLQIFPNKTVRGTMDRSPQRYVEFVFTTASNKAVVIQSQDKDASYYLCMHSTSEVYAREVYLESDCQWTEILLKNMYNAYQHKHHMRRKNRKRGIRKKRYFLGFNTDGTMRLGNMSRKTQKNSQFIKNSPSRTPQGPVIRPRNHSTKLPNRSVSAVTTISYSTVAPTKRPQPPKLGCKGLKTKYCRRMRRRWKKGQSIKHAKRHRKCKPRRLSNDKQALKDTRQLRRIQRRCQRIRRKRLERRSQSKTPRGDRLKLRTSMLTQLTTRVPHR